MLVEENLEQGLNLEKIDLEIRMERIRQNASKLTWDSFGHAVRRNLMEKKMVFDADARLDVLNAISIMRRKMPVDDTADFQKRLKQLADSLECETIARENGVTLKNANLTLEVDIANATAMACRIAYWNGQLEESEEALNLLRKGNFAKLRSGIFSILGLVPTSANLTRQEKLTCVDALRALEQLLMRHASDPSFAAINSAPYGFYRPRTSLSPGRLYFVAEPAFVGTCPKDAVGPGLKELDQLPYIELSFVENEHECQLPEFNHSGECTSFRPAHACLSIKFSRPMFFSHVTQRGIERFLARSPLIRHYCNLYRYMSNKDYATKDMVMRTRLPEPFVQQRYDVDVQCLKDENDPVVVDLYIKDVRSLSEVISVIRSEFMHNSLYESMLAACYLPWKGESTVRMKTVLSRHCFEFALHTGRYVVNMQFLELQACAWEAKVRVFSKGVDVSKLEERLTGKLNSSWSVVSALVLAMQALQCTPTPDLSTEAIESGAAVPNTSANTKPTASMRSESGKSDDFVVVDKVGSAWLTAKKKQKRTDDMIYEMEPIPRGGGLLAMYREVDEKFVNANKPPPPTPHPESRTRRLQSDTISANVFSDLNMIRQLANNMEDETRSMSTENAMTPGARTSIDSPALRPSSITQLSPLETARSRLAQSMSVATAVGLASCAPTPTSASGSGGIGSIGNDIFDFTEKSPSSSGFSTPSPHFVGQYSQMTQIRGTKTRRPRARKESIQAANMGDRLSTDSMYGMGLGASGGATPPTPSPGRGRPSTRRPRAVGMRKASGMTHADLLGMADNRPQLQRSFSDYPNINDTNTAMPSGSLSLDSPTPMSSMQSFGGHGPSPGASLTTAPTLSTVDDDSDDECDPPPPPKPLSGAPMLPPYNRTPTQASPLVQQSPSPSVPPNIAQSPNLTPSPLVMSRQDQKDIKPDVNALKASLSVSSTSSSASPSGPPILQPSTTVSGAQLGTPTSAGPSGSLTSQSPFPWLQQGQHSTPTGRKASSALEATISKIKANQPQKTKKFASDLFDDGTAPSPPESKPQLTQMQQMAAAGITANTTVGQALGHPMNISPKDLKEFTQQDASTSKTFDSKLVLKIPKNSRNSPTVDLQKMKTSSLPTTMPKLEKQERKKKEPKEGKREKGESKKRKADSKGRPESKKSKVEPGSPNIIGMSSTSSSSSKAPTLSAMSGSGTGTIKLMPKLPKNFRIPKKETNEDSKELANIALPSTAPPLASNPQGSSTSSSTSSQQPSGPSQTSGSSAAPASSAPTGGPVPPSSAQAPTASFTGEFHPSSFGAFAGPPMPKKKVSNAAPLNMPSGVPPGPPGMPPMLPRGLPPGPPPPGSMGRKMPPPLPDHIRDRRVTERPDSSQFETIKPLKIPPYHVLAKDFQRAEERRRQRRSAPQPGSLREEEDSPEKNTKSKKAVRTSQEDLRREFSRESTPNEGTPPPGGMGGRKGGKRKYTRRDSKQGIKADEQAEYSANQRHTLIRTSSATRFVDMPPLQRRDTPDWMDRQVNRNSIGMGGMYGQAGPPPPPGPGRMSGMPPIGFYQQQQKAGGFGHHPPPPPPSGSGGQAPGGQWVRPPSLQQHSAQPHSSMGANQPPHLPPQQEQKSAPSQEKSNAPSDDPGSPEENSLRIADE